MILISDFSSSILSGKKLQRDNRLLECRSEKMVKRRTKLNKEEKIDGGETEKKVLDPVFVPLIFFLLSLKSLFFISSNFYVEFFFQRCRDQDK